MMIKLRRDTKLPQYMMSPFFLLDFRLNATSLSVYMLLFDRARLSMTNSNWIDADGNVFLVYTVKQLANEVNRSERRVSAALTCLEKAGLIIRTHNAGSNANVIYVLIPSPDDNVRTGRLCHNGGDDTVSTIMTDMSGMTGRKRQPSNNYIVRTKESELISKATRTGYGEFRNVFLTKEEYARLLSVYPRLDRIIDKMSAWLASTGKTYQNYEAALKSWAAREPAGYENISYECKEDESL